MTFKQRLAEAGATDQQIQSKIASICEGVVAEMGAEDKIDVSLCKVQELVDEMKAIGERLMQEKMTCTHHIENLKKIDAEARKTLRDLHEGISTIDTSLVNPSEEVVQAVMLFEGVLETVKKSFGEDLSDEVMMSAIEAGSYGVWRSIMGEKHNPYKSDKKVRTY